MALRTVGRTAGGLFLLARLAIAVIVVLNAAGRGAADTLTVPYRPIPSIVEVSEDGSLTGYAVELGRRVAEIAGFEIAFERIPDGISISDAVSDPSVDLALLVGERPDMARTHVFSDPVLSTRTMLFVKAANWPDTAPQIEARKGLRIGYVEVLGQESNVNTRLWRENERVPFSTVDALLLAILDESVDAGLLGEGVFNGRAKPLGLDGEFYAIGNPVRIVMRHLALGKHRAEWLDPVNAAISELASSGELRALRRRWEQSVSATETPPEVLVFGAAHTPPFLVVGSKGEVSGFSADVMREVARRAGVKVEFKAVPFPVYSAGPAVDRFDITTLALDWMRDFGFDHTHPVGELAFNGYALASRAEDVRAMELDHLTVGLISDTAPERELRDRKDVDRVLYEDLLSPLEGLRRGEVDMAIFPEGAFEAAVEALGDGEAIELVRPDISRSDRVLLLRPGLAAIRDRLNGVIPGYVASEEYQALKTRYFGDPVVWTPFRIRVLVAGLAGVAIALGAVLYVLHNREIARTTQAQLKLMQNISLNLPDDITLVGADGTFKFYSPHPDSNLRYLREMDVVGRKYVEVLRELCLRGEYRIPEMTPEACFERIMEAGMHDGAVLEILGQDGTIWRRSTRHLPDGGILIVREDVTEDRRIRRSLQEGQSRLTAVMNAAQSGIVAMSRDGEILLANKSAVNILGLSENRPPFTRPQDIVFLDHKALKPLEHGRNPMERALSGETLRGEIAVVSDKLGHEQRYLQFSSASIGGEQLLGIGTVLVFEDISEQEKNRQVVERKGRLDALGQLTGGISHDFNNLLATIEYAVQLGMVVDDAAQRNELLETALRSVQRGADLTRRLLSFARRQPGMAKSVPVGEVLEDFRKLSSPVIEETISLEFSCPEREILVRCDVAQLENALLNLVLNARDAIIASGRGDMIIVSARPVTGEGALSIPPDLSDDEGGDTLDEAAKDTSERQGDSARYIEFSVRDNGPGMSDEVKRSAIDPFFTTKPTNSGTGLGLSIVYGFVRQSGGELRIFSEPGHGTIVRIILPRDSVSDDAEDHTVRSEESWSVPIADGPRKAIGD